LNEFVKELKTCVSTDTGEWTVKGFIDIYKNIYTISSDTKIVSKILEIHIFPEILQFAEKYGYKIILAEHQNWYPDLTKDHFYHSGGKIENRRSIVEALACNFDLDAEIAGHNHGIKEKPKQLSIFEMTKEEV